MKSWVLLEGRDNTIGGMMAADSIANIIGTGVSGMFKIDRKFCIPDKEDISRLRTLIELEGLILDGLKADSPETLEMKSRLDKAVFGYKEQLVWRIAHCSELTVLGALHSGAILLLTLGCLMVIAAIIDRGAMFIRILGALFGLMSIALFIAGQHIMKSLDNRMQRS